MLSKSNARRFFLTGTLLSAGAFVLLTLDTFQRIPGQTNEAQLTPAAIRGKHLFDRSNCMGCHTILGEGAYYAPELTKVYERRGEIFIKSMLRNPQAMYPGDRKMVNYHFSEQEIDDLVAFLKHIGTIDLNGFPAKPDLGVLPRAQAATGPARPQVFAQVCVACHTLGGSGGKVGPVLDGVGSRRDHDYFVRWLQDPAQVKPDAKMPKLPLTAEQVQELATFLSAQK